MKLPAALTPVNAICYVAFLVLAAFLGREAAGDERWLLLGAIAMGVIWVTLLVFQPVRRKSPN